MVSSLVLPRFESVESLANRQILLGLQIHGAATSAGLYELGSEYASQWEAPVEPINTPVIDQGCPLEEPHFPCRVAGAKTWNATDT